MMPTELETLRAWLSVLKDNLINAGGYCRLLYDAPSEHPFLIPIYESVLKDLGVKLPSDSWYLDEYGGICNLPYALNYPVEEVCEKFFPDTYWEESYAELGPCNSLCSDNLPEMQFIAVRYFFGVWVQTAIEDRIKELDNE